jgi:hypothetical protein
MTLCPTTHRALAGFALAAVFALAGGRGGIQSTAAGAASPASGHAQVIAQAVLELPDGPLAWEQATVSVSDGATQVPSGDPGFLIGSYEPVLVGDADDVRTCLEGGEALALRPNDALTAWAVSEGPATLTLLTLGPADASQADPERRLSDAFDSPGGNRDVDLVRDVLMPGELTTVAAGQAPTYVLVTEGAIGLETEDGEIELLAAGGRALETGKIVVIGAADGTASFVAAVIGAEVDRE